MVTAGLRSCGCDSGIGEEGNMDNRIEIRKNEGEPGYFVSEVGDDTRTETLLASIEEVLGAVRWSLQLAEHAEKLTGVAHG